MTKLQYLASKYLGYLPNKRELTEADLSKAYISGCQEMIRLVEDRASKDHDMDLLIWELQLIRDENNVG